VIGGIRVRVVGVEIARLGMLTVSGYIVNRERIEISPRFLGLVTWIGVKKATR